MNELITIGIDIVEKKRFISWIQFKNAQLLKIFSDEEIAYARQKPVFSAERLAVRFAAKEAFFKALQQINPELKMSFLSIAQAIHIKNTEHGMPSLLINTSKLPSYFSKMQFHSSLSLTHSSCCAMACILLRITK